ncbi:MAG: hypothetical protein WA988_11540, partial [Candidatus Nanopelagicales bacterium]
DEAARESNKQALRRLMSAIMELDVDAIAAESHDSLVFELSFDSVRPGGVKPSAFLPSVRPRMMT